MRTAVDLFAGAGGATQGLRDAGFDVIGAVENDADAAETFRWNHSGTSVWEDDIRSISARKFRSDLGLQSRELTLLKACPPCQGFSSLATSRSYNPDRDDLVRQLNRFIRELKPAAVLVENVPGLARDSRFGDLKDFLLSQGYSFQEYRVDAQDLGVPQRRKRLVIVAIRSKRVPIPVDVSDLIVGKKNLARLTAGDALRKLAYHKRTNDPLSRWRVLSSKTLERVRSVPVGGNRFDIPPEYRLACHNTIDLSGERRATASYGRVRVDQPAPTMTTRCTTPACGSFIHPTENRGLSLREAAWFQTFPVSYDFAGNYGSVERQIGNAVPVGMARKFAEASIKLVDLVPARSKLP